MRAPSLLFITSCLAIVGATKEDLIAGITRLNSDVIEVRNELEASLSNRCNSIRGCYQSSYDECQSAYTTSQTCPSLEELGYAVSECGAGKLCNALYDTSITTVRLPANLATGPNGNPTNHEVTEAICYSRSAQRWMVQKYNNDLPFWRSLGVNSPQIYFGSSTGVFRIFPARHSRDEDCGQYDPRTRPWYQASVPSTISNSVKQRRVVIMMDTSRSMDNVVNKRTGETRLSFMKKAVISTIDSLSGKASIAVVRFGENPALVGRPGSEEPFMWQQATGAHKERIKEEIRAIEVKGRSNWIAGFNFAFTLIKNSLRGIQARDPPPKCKLENIALLFFSDGEYNLPEDVTDEKIVKTVSTHVKQVEGMGDFSVHTFLYSIGYADPQQVSKQISCAVKGYWAAANGDRTPANLTSGYQSLFSTPMGGPMFYNYTAWSEPYNFSSSKKLGYTVSGLVYNRDVEPPRYMGAVGMDISAEAARHLYEGTMEETVLAMAEITNDIKEKKFNASCEQQRINLTYCEVQSVRQQYGGNDAICYPPEAKTDVEGIKDLLQGATEDNIVLDVDDSDVAVNISRGDDDGEAPTEAEKEEVVFDVLLNCSKAFVSQCAGYDEYPDDMWDNVEFAGKTFQERVCCEVGTSTVSEECPKLDEVRDTRLSDAAIFGILFGSIVAAELVCCYFCFHIRKRRNAS